MTDNQNVKLSPGKFYCWENSDYEIEVLGVAAGFAIVHGWKITSEPIRTDFRGNEYIRIENQTYYAFAKV